MVYDEGLATRVEMILDPIIGLEIKKMFGGLCYLVNGNMICGVVEDKLIARVPKDEYERHLKKSYVSPMDFTGKPMRGMIFVEEEGVSKNQILNKWVKKSLLYAQGLPPK